VTRGEDEASSAATFSALSEAAARRGARDAAEGAATLSMADEVAVGGELAAALSTDEFRRGMELAGIAGQIQVAADLVRGIGQPTLAAFLGRTGHHLHALGVDAIGRATEGAIVAHGAAHLAGDLAALGRTEMGEGREEYATSEAPRRRECRDGRGSRAIGHGRGRGTRGRDGDGEHGSGACDGWRRSRVRRPPDSCGEDVDASDIQESPPLASQSKEVDPRYQDVPEGYRAGRWPTVSPRRWAAPKDRFR